MSRRNSRSAARKAGADSRRPAPPATHEPAHPKYSRPRPNKWFLTATVLMQAAWITFLTAMALLD